MFNILVLLYTIAYTYGQIYLTSITYVSFSFFLPSLSIALLMFTSGLGLEIIPLLKKKQNKQIGRRKRSPYV